MDFFAHQEVARRNTGKLIALFALAVVGMIAAVYTLLVAVLQLAGEGQFGGWWQPDLLLLAAGGTILVVALGSGYRMLQLRSGGRAVAEMMGALPVQPNTREPRERMLINVVEEMSVASGVPVPGIYVMDREPAINAFAAGYAPGDAVVAVTRGTLEQLSRDELQGVIAHEFSHILNGDMRLNIRLIGVLHGILCVGLAGYVLLRSAAYGGRYGSVRSRNDKGSSAVALLALGAGLIAIGYIGVFFAKLIQAAVSRQREFLADASAVQFTRNPAGLAGALKRIAGFDAGSRLATAQAQAASHMFFVDALRSSLKGWMATHPPLEERIRRIDRHFEAPAAPPPARGRTVVAPAAVGFAGASAGLAAGPRTPRRLVESIGQPRDAHLAHTAALLEALPMVVSAALHEPFAARALVLGLLLHRERDARRAQLDVLRHHADAATAHGASALARELEQLDRAYYLPLLDLAMPALRDMSNSQYEAFSRAVRALAHADEQVDVWEFALQKVLLRHLGSHFLRPPSPRVRFRTIQRILDDCQVLLSALAHTGHPEASAAAAAYAAGFGTLPGDGYPRPLLDAERCTMAALDRSLERIAQASPGCKQMVLRAGAATAAHDGEVAAAEVELLRAIADTLDCPMPPLLEDDDGAAEGDGAAGRRRAADGGDAAAFVGRAARSEAWQPKGRESR